MNKLILLIMTLSLFTGCTLSQDKYLINKQLVYINIPEKLYNDDINVAQIDELVNSETYINSSPIKREKILAKLIIKLYGSIGLYKNKLHSIAEYEVDVNEIINDKDKINMETVKKLINDNE